MLERYIAEHISTRLPNFDMPTFCAQLREVLPLSPVPSHQAHQLTPASLLALRSGRRSCPSPTLTWTRLEPLATLRRLRCDAATARGKQAVLRVRVCARGWRGVRRGVGTGRSHPPPAVRRAGGDV